MGEIVEFPDTKNLKEKIKTLRENLEELLIEKDNLESIVCENIKTKYTLLFGGLEYRLYKAYCEYLRLRRKKDMIQAKKNREEKINIKAIEADLDNEFIDYKRKLDEKISEVNNALERSKLKALSKDETNEMKKIIQSYCKEATSGPQSQNYGSRERTLLSRDGVPQTRRLDRHKNYF